MRIAVAGGTGLVGSMLAQQARERGHEVVVLARSTGSDLLRGQDVATLIEGCDAVVDVLNVATLDAKASRRFFVTTTHALLAAEAVAGVRHHLALSIVGVDRAPYGYWAGKLAQEQAIEAGPVPWTLLRATQFHEFAAQSLARGTFGPLHLATRMRTRPVAAAEVAARLVQLAEARPTGHVTPLAGPREEWLPDMVRAYAEVVRVRGPVVTITLPGAFGRALREGAALPGPDADLAREPFTSWLGRTARDERWRTRKHGSTLTRSAAARRAMRG